jgi:hypothetical protein
MQPRRRSYHATTDQTDHLAPQLTIDALLYSLRAGAAVLSRPDVQRRLAMLDERQMRNCCALLLNRTVAKSWTADEIEMFVIAWAACHG